MTTETTLTEASKNFHTHNLFDYFYFQDTTDNYRYTKRKVLAFKIDPYTGKSLAHYCAETGNENAIHCMVDTNSNIVSEYDKNGKSLFYYAATNGHLNIIKYLVTHLILKEINNPNPLSEDQLFKLITMGINITDLQHQEVCDYFSMLETKLAYYKNFLISIQGAIYASNWVALKPYLEQILVDLKEKRPEALTFVKIVDWRTIFMFYSASGIAEIKDLIELSKALIEKPVLTFLSNTETFPAAVTPLHQAAKNANLEAIKYFIAQGINVNVRDHAGSTPLHYACLAPGDNKEVIDYLIERGAEVNAVDHLHNTPLHLACLCLFFPLGDNKETLIKHGANVNAKNYKAKTPQALAEEPPPVAGKVDIPPYAYEDLERITALATFIKNRLEENPSVTESETQGLYHISKTLPKQYDSVQSNFLKYINIDKHDPPFYCMLAHIYQLTGDHHRFLKLYLKYFIDHPDENTLMSLINVLAEENKDIPGRTKRKIKNWQLVLLAIFQSKIENDYLKNIIYAYYTALDDKALSTPALTNPSDKKAALTEEGIKKLLNIKYSLKNKLVYFLTDLIEETSTSETFQVKATENLEGSKIAFFPSSSGPQTTATNTSPDLTTQSPTPSSSNS